MMDNLKNFCKSPIKEFYKYFTNNVLEILSIQNNVKVFFFVNKIKMSDKRWKIVKNNNPMNG